ERTGVVQHRVALGVVQGAEERGLAAGGGHWISLLPSTGQAPASFFALTRTTLRVVHATPRRCPPSRGCRSPDLARANEFARATRDGEAARVQRAPAGSLRIFSAYEFIASRSCSNDSST